MLDTAKNLLPLQPFVFQRDCWIKEMEKYQSMQQQIALRFTWFLQNDSIHSH